MRIQFALASVILIWFAYYMNRPHPWNLWTFLFLYSFVVVDYLSMRRLSLLWRRRGLLTLLDMRMAVVVWLLLPNALYFNHMLIRYEIDYFRDAAEADLASISGITIPKAMVATLVEKVAFLETVRDKDTTIYLTGDSFIIPLMTKQFNPFSVQDVYLENFRADDFEHVVNDFKTSNAKYLLIDEPSSILAATDSAATLRFEFFKKIMKRLAPQYREIGAQSDWRIWERTAPDLQPAHLSPT